MASSNHAILDLGDEDLQFTTNDYKSKDGQSSMTSFPEPNSQTDRDTDRIIDGESSRTNNFWSMSFYQQYFDVEDKDVLNRLLYSMVPIPGKSFLQHHIRPKPDLYGPFWSCVTLIFSIAISGNIADYLTTSLMGQAKWHYDFHKVTLASTAVFSYAGLTPACLYGYLWWAGQGGGSLAISFLELVCLYGYSVTIYIPISVLWLVCVKIGWLQWVLVLVGATLSGAVLFTTVWPAVRENAAKSAGIVMIVVLGLHFLLACGFMLYFFHASSAAASPDVTPASTLAPVLNSNNSLPLSEALKNVEAEEKVTRSIDAVKSANAALDDEAGEKIGGKLVQQEGKRDDGNIDQVQGKELENFEEKENLDKNADEPKKDSQGRPVVASENSSSKEDSTSDTEQNADSVTDNEDQKKTEEVNERGKDIGEKKPVENDDKVENKSEDKSEVTEDRKEVSVDSTVGKAELDGGSSKENSATAENVSS